MIFFTEEQDRQLGADTAKAPLAITPTIRWLDITFEPTVAGAPIAFNGMSIDAERPRGGALPVMLGNSSGSNLRQQGGWSFRHGTTHVRWLVAAGNLKLEATQTFQMLVPGSNGWSSKPVDTVEIDIAEPAHRATLRIPPPPTDAELERPAAK